MSGLRSAVIGNDRARRVLMGLGREDEPGQVEEPAQVLGRVW